MSHRQVGPLAIWNRFPDKIPRASSQYRAPPSPHPHTRTAPPFPETTAMDAGAAAAAGGLDDSDSAFFSRRGHHRRCCCCFPWPSSSSSSPHARRADEEWWHGVGEGSAGAGAARRKWWRRGVDAVMKVREWSELVAGPRWKTFIRRFRRGGPRHSAATTTGGGGGGGGGGGCGGTGRKLNYDPLSYALNFDEGHGGSPDGDYTGYRDFSARFVAPATGSNKASMDLGGRDAPPLFHSNACGPDIHQHHPHPHSPRSPRKSVAAAAAALRR